MSFIRCSNRISSTIVCAWTAALLFGAGSNAQAVVPEYTILDLGSLGGLRSEAFGLNNSGQVVGWANDAGGAQRAFLTAPNSPINPATDALPLLGGGASNFAYAVNSSGQVTGYGGTSAGDRAFRYTSSGGTMTTLSTLGGNWGYGNAINSAGNVVGGSATKNGVNSPTDPVLYTGATPHDIGTLGGDAYAQAINSSGAIVGYSALSNFSTHAFLWTPTIPNATSGTMLDIDPWGSSYSAAWAMNDAGQIVGGADTAGDVAYHAFLRGAGATPTTIDLNTLGGASSEARSINAMGMVVGTSAMASGPNHAFLWVDGAMRDLNVLAPGAAGWTLTNAMAINDSGQIAGYGTNSTGQHHAFLLSPVPMWQVDANGAWSGTTNWLGGVPGGTDAEVRFTNAISAPRTVTLDTPRTVGHVVFDSTNSYTLAGPATLTVSGAAGSTGLEVRSGAHVISVPVNFLGNTATIGISAGASLKLAGHISGGISQLGLGAGAQLDLTSNSLAISYPSDSPLGTIAAQVASGYNGGAWNGPGIVSSTAAANAAHTTGIGFGEASSLHLTSFNGQSIQTPALLLKYTYLGDANLDGRVDVTDLGALASNWQTSSTWTGGDFNYDGFVDVSDLGALATNWQAGVGTPLGESLQDALAHVGLSASAVPEPASAGFIALCLLVLPSRQRRRPRRADPRITQSKGHGFNDERDRQQKTPPK